MEVWGYYPSSVQNCVPTAPVVVPELDVENQTNDQGVQVVDVTPQVQVAQDASRRKLLPLHDFVSYQIIYLII